MPVRVLKNQKNCVMLCEFAVYCVSGVHGGHTNGRKVKGFEHKL